MFRGWLQTAMPAGEYYGWVCESQAPEVVAGAGVTIIRWPPGPSDVRGDRIAFVYNVYTEPAHRRRGLARRLMETIHDWCRARGIARIALNAAPAAHDLYKLLGYFDASNPMMWKIT
jgi:GNAT superfamily N-acetyltransferase